MSVNTLERTAQSQENGKSVKDYSEYQREILLGLNETHLPEKRQQAQPESTMAKIKRRLEEKKAREEELHQRKLTQLQAATWSAPTEVIQQDETQSEVPTQVIAQETQQIETQILDTQNVSVAEANDDDDDDEDGPIVLHQRKLLPTLAHSNFNSDSESDSDADKGTLKTQQITGKISQKGNEATSDADADDDDDEIIKMPRRTVATAEIISDFPASQIEDYSTMTREEKIKARLEQKKAQRKQIEQEAESANLLKDNNTNKDLSSSKAEAVLKKLEREKSKERKLKALERRQEIQLQNELIAQAAEGLFEKPKSSLTKGKFLEAFSSQLSPERQSIPIANDSITDNNFFKSPSKSKNMDEIKLIAAKTLLKKRSNDKAIHFSSDESDLSSEDEADKIRILEFKRKFSKKSKEAKIKHRESLSLQTQIKRCVAKQSRKRIDKKTEREPDLQENMILSLLAREQMLEGQKLKRKEKEEKSKLKFNLNKSNWSDPEFSGSDNDVESDAKMSIASDDSDTDTQQHDNFQMKMNLTQAINGSSQLHSVLPSQDFQLSQLITQQEISDSKKLNDSDKFNLLRGNVNGLSKLNSVQSIDENFENDELWGLSTENVVFTQTQTQTQNQTQTGNQNRINSANGNSSFNMEFSIQEENEDPEAELGTQIDLPALKRPDQITKSISLDDNEVEVEEDDEDEQITVGRRRDRFEQSDAASDIAQLSGDDDDIEIEETPEERLQRRQMFKLAKAKEKEERKKRAKKMKELGLMDIVEEEANESDSDNVNSLNAKVDHSDSDSDDMNSEDEKLINDARVSVNKDKIRQYHFKEEIAKDTALLERTYKDVKTHKFRDRRAKDGVYDIDFSDDEDEQMMILRMRLQEHRKKKQLDLNKRNDLGIKKDNKQYAFHQSMIVKLPSKIISFRKESQDSLLKEINSDSDITSTNKEQSQLQDVEIEIPPALAAKENQQRTLAAPKKRSRELDIESFKEQANIEAVKQKVLDEFSSDDEEGLRELKRVKTLSRTNSYAVSRSNSNRQSQKFVGDNEFDGAEDENLDSFSILAAQRSSVTSSFKRATTKKVRKSMYTGNIIREVEVTTSSRPVMNSKGAVTKLVAQDNKKELVEDERMNKMMKAGRKNGVRKLGTGKFRR
ncbi:hypothetical protein DAMA08_001150 [Martiniozyma asiatica (nom. inval.)]|nr:hypothetical protein DAMA08_001150 [Martiniozyma asiatica]